MTTTNHTARNFIMIILLVILAVIISPLFTRTFVTVESYVNGRSHAAEKHGLGLALEVRKCLNNNGAMEIWTSSERQTFAECVELDKCDWCDHTKRWGIKITDRVTGEEITIFAHEGNYVSLEHYLMKQLYTLIFSIF